MGRFNWVSGLPSLLSFVVSESASLLLLSRIVAAMVVGDVDRFRLLSGKEGNNDDNRALFDETNAM